MQPLSSQFRLSRASATRLFGVGMLVAAAIGILGAMHAGPITPLDRLLLDQYVRSSSSDGIDDRMVVVDVDEVSLSAVGQWPWPRYRVAALIEKVAAQKPAAVGLDILFSEPDRSSLVNIRQSFKRDFGIDIAFSGVPDALSDNDSYLAQVIDESNIVASNYLYFDHFNNGRTDARPGLAFDGDIDRLSLLDATGILLNADEIAKRTHITGFMNNQLDPDGVLRRTPLLIRHRGVIHPSLALATTMHALGIDRATVAFDGHGPLLVVGPHRIPIDENGYATLRFEGGPRRHPAIAAVDILAGRFDPRDIAGKIVFIGSSAVGLNDVHDTAVDPHFPGLKVQSVAAGNLVDDRFIRTPTWTPFATFVACLAAGAVVASLFVLSVRVAWIVVGSILAALAAALPSIALFAGTGSFVSPAAPLVTTAALFVIFSVTRFAIEKRRAFVWLKQLQNTRQVTIESMASVAETRDPETGAHIKRTQHYVKVIAEELRRTGHHVGTLTDEYIQLLFISAPLHDIGKVGVPDHILLKPGRLTPAEFEIMKKHADFGRKIIFSSAKNIEGDNFLQLAGEIAATHHEKWDGTGYPMGLAGEAIPLSGRIMAAADIYDALISRRCYKEAFGHSLAIELMREARGTIFDPAVLDAFFRIESKIIAIAAEYGDESGTKADVLPISVPDEFIGTLVGA